MDVFLKGNPKLQSSLISRGARGANAWAQMVGPYPGITKIRGFGEFRSTGSLTVIAGPHKSGVQYTLINAAPPVRLRYDEIIWPPGTPAPAASLQAHRHDAGSSTGAIPPGGSSPNLDTESLRPAPLDTSLLHNSATIAGKLRQENQFRTTNPVLHHLGNSLLSSLLPLQEGSRNIVLTQEVAPRLFTACSLRAAMTILEHLVGLNELGGYPPSDAREKLAHALSAMLDKYPGLLRNDEREIYLSLDKVERCAFRICRALAACETPAHPPPKFFLSSGELSGRLLLGSSMEAWRLLKKFQRYQFITVLTPGLRRALGQAGRAAEYSWNLSLAPPVGILCS
jgi:hypothetical protein